MASTTRLRRFPIGNLGQGIISDQNPLEIPMGSCVPNTLNVVWVEGFLRARSGLLSVYQLPVTDRVHHLTVHQTLTGTRNLMAVSLKAATGVATVYYRSASTWVAVGTIPSPYVTANVPMTSCDWGGTTYLTSGNGPIYYFDGTTFAQLNTLQPSTLFQAADAVKILVAGDARLVAANLKRDAVVLPYRVEWSDFSIPGVWGGAIANQGGDSGGTVLPKNSDAITGLYVDSSVLTIFRAREIYLGVEVGSPAVYNARCFVQGPGCVAHATIQPYRDGAIVWLGDDNVYIGAPGQQPRPIGDRIRLRIRQVARVSSLDQAKAQLDYDHQLYTLYLPDITTGNLTRMFTCNLRNGGWWEGSIADPSMIVTDTVAYRISPWQTQNLVGTTDGRILQSILGYSRDDVTDFPCTWQSSIIPSRAAFGADHEQASVQSLRVVAQRNADTGPNTVTFALLHGDNIDNFTATAFSPQQVFDGASTAFTNERVTNENFQILIAAAKGTQFPTVAQVEIGAIPQGMSRS